jgi:hypothetical protein
MEYTKPSTRSSSENISILSTFMKKASPEGGSAKVKLSLQSLQEQITLQNTIIDTQTETINKLVQQSETQNNTIQQLKLKLQANTRELESHQSLMRVKDCVFEALQKEVYRLQQYTRRYSVVVAGLEKSRGEKPDDLLKKVKDLVVKVDSTTTFEDVDKFHRNGPSRDGEQEVIVRFKSHSAKEQFYRKRKSLAEGSKIKIRPSLSPHNKALLHEAQAYLEENVGDLPMDNPPEFVFANIHGDIQVKFSRDTKKGMFVNFYSVQELACVIAHAQFEKQTQLTTQESVRFDTGDGEEL